MRLPPKFWSLVSLLCLVGAWFFWQQGNRWTAERKAAPAAATAPAGTKSAGPSAAQAPGNSGHVSAISTNRLTFRLTNTAKTITQLQGDRHAILLQNAFIDTSAALNLKIPSQLKADGDPGAYIVQARGPIGAAFRAALAAAGAQIVSYIPNNAYLVRLSADAAGGLAANALVQSVLPYEPYYKVQPSLLGLAVDQQPLPPGTYLTLGLFGDTAAATEAQIKQLGGIILSQDRSPFGQVVRVSPPADWVSLVNLTGVQIVEPAHLRAAANDLARPVVGVTTDSVTQTNWLGLTGSNVLVEVNDSGIDVTHPDFSMNHTVPVRVTGYDAESLADTLGHGTHVAGIIAGDGFESLTVTNASGSIMPATNGQFRGMAPGANLFSLGFLGANDTNEIGFVGDSTLQETPALTNALISNNSWQNVGDNEYDLSAASYDAAVRDALPTVTGPQPVLFVFAAGNDGLGDTEGQEGTADTITSPGTAKDVITVGALEQNRNITNLVTDINGNTNPIWSAETDSSDQVADYSARGNVGVETEGASGRFKPDVVAPGTFMISTRSQQWDQAAYYNPTNYHEQNFLNQVVTSNTYSFGSILIPQNAVGVTIQVVPNALSASPFPTNLLIYASADGSPIPTNAITYDLLTSNNLVAIPPDSGGLIGSISDLQGGELDFAVGDSTNIPINFDVDVQIITTNDNGNELEVLSNLNNSLSGSAPYWYRYETGTSMATPAVSGVLACMQEYFTNNLLATPSPALLKAMLINGARPVGSYSYAITNTLNLDGWGAAQLDNSIPAGLTNAAGGTNGTPMFFVDQSPTNALATGESQTYNVSVTPGAITAQQPLRVTLVWTDPPGNPAAAIKLVNNLDVVVTNLADSSVYYANNFTPGSPPYTLPSTTNSPPVLDYVNNVRNIFIPPLLGTNYTVTVIGRSVNVNAVTLEQTNVVQDYALVISTGDGDAASGIMVTSAPPVAAGFTNVTYLIATNGIYFNQTAGASAPLLSTNNVTVGVSTNADYGTAAVDYIGQSNQWHFYVITNTYAITNAAYTNAAFVTFLPNTLSLPREGVFAGSDANSTRPEADIDLYVADSQTDLSAPGLLGLDPNVVSNCVNGNLGDGASLTEGGTEFVAYQNSVGGDVYYIGVQSQDQTSAQYGFIAVFSDKPFSQMNGNDEIVNGVPLPMNIPDGNNAHPGVAYVFGLALTPMEINRVIVTNVITHQNFGDLVGALSHGTGYDVLNNHDGFGPVVNTNLVYDDSGQGDIIGSRGSDGPGSLKSFIKQQAIGPWLLNMVDDAPGNTGSISSFELLIQPHQDPRKGLTVTVGPHQWFYTYLDVPVGYYNLSLFGTNLTVPPATPPIQMYLQEGSEPTFASTNMVLLTNGTPEGNVISLGPPLEPDTYYIGLYNPSDTPQTVYLIADLAFNANTIQTVDYPSTDTPLPITDDALTLDPNTLEDSTITVTNQQTIQGFTVGLRVDHPRISDMVFTLISPNGNRYLLMENRGGVTTNGCGATILTTNEVNSVASGDNASSTNVIDVGSPQGTFQITYNFYNVPDEMTVYYGTNLIPANQVYDSGFASNGPPGGPYTPTSITINYPPSTATQVSSNLTIVMNQFGNPNVGGDLWTYTAGGVTTNFIYLDFTEDTNLTTTPIKFAPVPFVPPGFISANFVLSDFESAAAGDYATASIISDESTWSVLSNQVSVVNDPANAYQGTNFLALANGTISNTIPTVPGAKYTLTYAYRGPGAVGFWRGESNGLDSVGSDNGVLTQVGFAPGEVGSAFVFAGGQSSNVVDLGDPASLQFTNSFSIDAWIWVNGLPTAANYNQGNIFFRGDTRSFLDPYYFAILNTGGLCFHIADDSGNMANLDTSPIPQNQWVHVAAVFDGVSGLMQIYANGLLVGSQTTAIRPFQNLDPSYYPGAAIGNCESGVGTAAESFNGLIDELTVYQRKLSASEVQAIYQKGSAGKFDPTVDSPLNLAEADVSIPGVNTNEIYGDNTNWQTQTITFTATSTNTPIVITGIEPGMLLDNFTVSGVGGGTLDYQPEQDISGLIGTSAYGFWQMEVLDNRAGATNPAPILQSWHLQFTFANTNYFPLGSLTFPILTNGVPATNGAPIPPGGVVYYEVDVPPNADAATNILLYADGPLNVWWSTNYPPTVGGPNDYLLIGGKTNGTSVLTAGSTPPLIPGTTYYLGLQNTNSFAITNYAVQVDFDLLGQAYAYTEPATLVTGASAQLNGMATPNGYAANAWFEWGTNTAYGNVTPPQPVDAGYNVVFTTNQIYGLITNQPYHFRLVVSNSLGAVYGFDQVLDQAYVAAWGANYAGQINVPKNLNNSVVAIAGAYDHSLALQTNGLMVAWGDNSFGQTAVPSSVSNVVAVAGGYYYSMALGSDGTVTAWGVNLLNSLSVPTNLNNVVEIAGGTYSSLALQASGNVVAWGASFFNLTNPPANTTNIVAVAGGSYHNLALKNDGTVTVWGDNSSGQTNIPPGLTNVVAIAAGGYHSLALRSDGTVVAWGDDGDGQTNVPPGLNDVVAIAAGGFHSLALKANGTIVAWGDASAGQTIVPGVLRSNVVAIAAGYLQSLVLTPLRVNSTNSTLQGITPGGPQTNSLFAGEVAYYQVNVPTNADFATNNLLFALNGPLNVWFSTNSPPTVGGANDSLLLAGVTNGISILSATTTPPLVPGSTYYLGVQNTNSVTVTYGLEVDFHLLTGTSTNSGPQTNTIPISSIVATNGGFLLTWYAPSNDLFQVQWSDSLPFVWQTFTNIVSYDTNYQATATNATFTYFDDGSQAPFTGSRYYQLILLGSAAAGNTPPVLPAQTNQVVNPLNLLVVTNTATDAEVPAPTLTYTLTSTVTDTNPPVISTNGIITWTPDGSQAGTSNVFTTVVTDSGTPPLSATNAFAVIVNPVPGISSVTLTNGDYLLTWFAPTNDIFSVQVSTNLGGANWQTIGTNIVYLGPVVATNGQFTFLDDGSVVPFGSLRFYRLQLTGVTSPAVTPSPVVSIGSIVYTNGDFVLTWSAPTNDQFEVQWTTNIVTPVMWSLFPGTNTSTTGTFTFTDTNLQMVMKFYQLILLP